MTSSDTITIYHNPRCSTSRKVLDAIRAAGHEPVVVDYLKTGWKRPQLTALLKAAGLTPRQALRTKQEEAKALLAEEASDERILEAMLELPVLVERPIVQTPKGVRLVRPLEKLDEILCAPGAQAGRGTDRERRCARRPGVCPVRKTVDAGLFLSRSRLGLA